MAGASPGTLPGKRARASTLASAPTPSRASAKTSARASIPIPANGPTEAPNWAPAPALHLLLQHPQLNQNLDLLFKVF